MKRVFPQRQFALRLVSLSMGQRNPSLARNIRVYLCRSVAFLCMDAAKARAYLDFCTQYGRRPALQTSLGLLPEQARGQKPAGGSEEPCVWPTALVLAAGLHRALVRTARRLSLQRPRGKKGARRSNTQAHCHALRAGTARGPGAGCSPVWVVDSASRD